MSFSSSAHAGAQAPRKLAPLAAIVVVHLILFYLLQTGMLSKVVHAALPRVVEISFVTPPKPVAPPKTVPVVRHSASVTPPPLPLLAIPQIEPTITPPPPQAAHAADTPLAAVATPTVAPAPPSPATPKLVSGVEYLRPPQPNYPQRSRRMGEAGTVILRVLINERGQAEQVLVEKSSGYDALDDEGRSAVQRTLFKPRLEDGKPVAVYALVPINFQQRS
ncbi:energy transducer TonB [Rugamonas sp.]|uniref:energy transducer TonB n=1 Tax=Rugamonas sp. TaxID=1926287 RepID=UPI0025FEDE91|nr:energy transducer TonB [Rugamonas sp.]